MKKILIETLFTVLITELTVVLILLKEIYQLFLNDGDEIVYLNISRYDDEICYGGEKCVNGYLLNTLKSVEKM